MDYKAVLAAEFNAMVFGPPKTLPLLEVPLGSVVRGKFAGNRTTATVEIFDGAPGLIYSRQPFEWDRVSTFSDQLVEIVPPDRLALESQFNATLAEEQQK